jgi:hypothetical protein
MRVITDTIPCPRCDAPSVLTVFQHTDERGHTMRHELDFRCPHGDVVPLRELMADIARHNMVARG